MCGSRKFLILLVLYATKCALVVHTSCRPLILKQDVDLDFDPLAVNLDEIFSLEEVGKEFWFPDESEIITEEPENTTEDETVTTTEEDPVTTTEEEPVTTTEEDPVTTTEEEPVTTTEEDPVTTTTTEDPGTTTEENPVTTTEKEPVTTTTTEDPGTTTEQPSGLSPAEITGIVLGSVVSVGIVSLIIWKFKATLFKCIK